MGAGAAEGGGAIGAVWLTVTLTGTRAEINPFLTCRLFTARAACRCASASVRCVPALRTAGAVGSFSNKPLDRQNIYYIRGVVTYGVAG